MLVIPWLRELLASVSIQTARKACEGDVGGLRRVVYCIHPPVDRTQSRDSTPRQKTWTVQARAAVKLDRFQLWQRSWLPSCFRSAGCRRQLAKKTHSLGHIKTWKTKQRRKQSAFCQSRQSWPSTHPCLWIRIRARPG